MRAVPAAWRPGLLHSKSSSARPSAWWPRSIRLFSLRPRFSRRALAHPGRAPALRPATSPPRFSTAALISSGSSRNWRISSILLLHLYYFYISNDKIGSLQVCTIPSPDTSKCLTTKDTGNKGRTKTRQILPLPLREILMFLCIPPCSPCPPWFTLPYCSRRIYRQTCVPGECR